MSKIRNYKFRLYPNSDQEYRLQNNLAVRIHRCNICNLVLDRDHNASINILKKSSKIFNLSAKADYHKLPQELRKVTPTEISMRSMKQEEAIGLVQ